MKTYTTTEKILVSLIILVLVTICAVLYFGVSYLYQSQKNTITEPVDIENEEVVQEESASAERASVVIPKTPEEKMKIVESLKKSPEELHKTEQLQIMEGLSDDVDEELTVDQKMNILNQL